MSQEGGKGTPGRLKRPVRRETVCLLTGAGRKKKKFTSEVREQSSLKKPDLPKGEMLVLIGVSI